MRHDTSTWISSPIFLLCPSPSAHRRGRRRGFGSSTTEHHWHPAMLIRHYPLRFYFSNLSVSQYFVLFSSHLISCLFRKDFVRLFCFFSVSIRKVNSVGSVSRRYHRKNPIREVRVHHIRSRTAERNNIFFFLNRHSVFQQTVCFVFLISPSFPFFFSFTLTTTLPQFAAVITQGILGV